jgi:inorganic pyrophosphatase
MQVDERVHVRVEVPRGGRVKWGADGGIDFVSPLACPFNYGSALFPPSQPSLGGRAPLAEDGDPPDVIVLGPRLDKGAELEVLIVGVLRFTDAGKRDDKWVGLPAGVACPGEAEAALLVGFFRRYVWAKRLMNGLSLRFGPTRLGGLERAGW